MKHIHACRFVYNHSLEQKIRAYEQEGKKTLMFRPEQPTHRSQGKIPMAQRSQLAVSPECKQEPRQRLHPVLQGEEGIPTVQVKEESRPV
ncbi:MAG TPA: helix-turn-helix domain-containing protein [Bacillota bacterium]|nr:helix-turn-helix domain-containing protein [Bacillota bacterium]